MSLKRKVDNAVREKRRQDKQRRRRRRTSGERGDPYGMPLKGRLASRRRRQTRRERPRARARKQRQQRVQIVFGENGERLYRSKGIVGR